MAARARVTRSCCGAVRVACSCRLRLRRRAAGLMARCSATAIAACAAATSDRRGISSRACRRPRRRPRHRTAAARFLPWRRVPSTARRRAPSLSPWLPSRAAAPARRRAARAPLRSGVRRSDTPACGLLDAAGCAAHSGRVDTSVIGMPVVAAGGVRLRVGELRAWRDRPRPGNRADRVRRARRPPARPGSPCTLHLDDRPADARRDLGDVPVNLRIVGRLASRRTPHEERDYRKHHDSRDGQHRPAAAEAVRCCGARSAAAFQSPLRAITAILREMPSPMPPRCRPPAPATPSPGCGRRAR